MRIINAILDRVAYIISVGTPTASGRVQLRFTRKSDQKSRVKRAKSEKAMYDRLIAMFADPSVRLTGIKPDERMTDEMTATLAHAVSLGVDPHSFAEALPDLTPLLACQIAQAARTIQKNFALEGAVNQKWGSGQVPELDTSILSALGV